MPLASQQLEIFRRGVGLAPEPGRGQDGSAIYVQLPQRGVRPLRSCTCRKSRRGTCEHLKRLSRELGDLRSVFGGRSWEDVFDSTVWYRLARLIHEEAPIPYREIRVALVPYEDTDAVHLISPKGRVVARYLDDGPARVRFLERTAKLGVASYSDRAGLLDRLALFQTSEAERRMGEYGMKTRRQSWEEGLWHRLAYHCVREHGLDSGTFHPRVDRTSGDMNLLWEVDGRPIVQVTLPRRRVQATFNLLRAAYPGQEDLALHPLPLRSIFYVSPDTELDLVEVRPFIRALQEDGEEHFFAREDLEKYRYGNLVFVPELGILAEMERTGSNRKFQTPQKMRLQRSQVASFLEEHAGEVAEGSLVLDEGLRGLEILDAYDHLTFVPEGDGEGTDVEVSLRYGFGDLEVGLPEVLRARAEGLPYLETKAGWIDLRAPAFRGLERLEGWRDGETAGLRLPAREVLRLRAEAGDKVRVEGTEERAELVHRLLSLRPAQPFAAEGLVSELRDYQRVGVDWLRFLAENHLGGLLCDDMGLGKTHQGMGLMVSLREQDGVTEPFLVVAPRSVLSHWRQKLAQYAPGLSVVLHHGPGRDLDVSTRSDVVLTSYGVLRRDAEKLSRVRFGLAIFDEIQHLKNRGTVGYEAGRSLVADVKVGLTGTPIENSLKELKTLFDLVLPGYLGSDDTFEERFGSGDADLAGEDLVDLRRTIAPFVLRRLKSTVLEELPDKIEDVVTCELSPDQRKLYREALATRGAPLAARIREGKEPIPYLHVFALLSYLKQVCDHPALALRDLDAAPTWASGKWELYQELLREALDSGQKVVVFTQYLGMIELMRRHLDEADVGHVVLTGATRKRGEVVDRFNTDDDCRVFLGSLKAGGTGIDLIGGSVVIHYDRWWTAAREDQATDRVHRIGQRRAVQVLKLVTENTLEEKIGMIVERKRELMDRVVEEDDPRLNKIFSKDELLSMIQAVEA